MTMSQMLPEYAGCLWPADPACLGERWDNLDDEVRERALALASSTLRRLTAFRVGGCPVTVRPCSPRGFSRSFVPFTGSFGREWMSPGVNGSGQWVNSCGCSGGCGCTITGSVHLAAPVGEVYEVKVNGNIIDPDDYRVVENSIVWQGDGPSPFPAMQDLSLPDSLPGTFSITYLNAYPVDLLGAQAAAYLALEFAKACKGKGKCDLPRGVTQVVRSGVSFSIEAGLFPNGRTGIDIVDAFLDLWNPERRTQASKVWTPDNYRRN
jgi:hypothetical protein